MKKSQKRYEIHAIADADCTEINSEVLAATDDRDEAERLAVEHSNYIWGSAVLDTITGDVDFGCGYSDVSENPDPANRGHREGGSL